MTSRGDDVDAVAETLAADVQRAAFDVTATDAGRTPADTCINDNDLTGRTLAHFRLDALIGRGGMGEVYRATDTALDRVVAIKVLPRAVGADERLRARFFREARAQARLQHAHVCHIYYIGDEDGLLFFAMEHIDGESVQAMLERRGTLPVPEALELCRMAALALREAHTHGFTHRDVKPSNLMIDRRGVVKVVDFGLVTEARERVTGGLGVSTTQTAIVGTPLYMAPEQGRGDAVDFRADVYALGATLHHLVSGKPPFGGETPREVVTKHETEARPSIQVKKRRSGPAPIDALCDRMMAKDPAARFGSYEDLIGTIERISPEHTRPAGFWVRAFALTIDLLLVRVALLPLDFLGAGWMGAVFGVALPAYVLLGHGFFGRTLGKAALEIEVVPADSDGRLGVRAAAVRFLIQWGPLYLLFGGTTLIEELGGAQVVTQVLAVIAMVVGALLYPLEGALSSMTPAKRTIWDRLANTRVRYRPTRTSESQSFPKASR
ncbi:MAG TPA: protein kinase [Kofleriaceae bacterium]|nr:protein kinase [Kofleriaceae bacterium]